MRGCVRPQAENWSNTARNGMQTVIIDTIGFAGSLSAIHCPNDTIDFILDRQGAVGIWTPF
jgi:hypothetical protein